MSSNFKIPGDPIIGLNDLFVGLAKAGTPAPPRQPPPAGARGGKGPAKGTAGPGTKEGHAAAKAASINVLQAGKKLLNVASKAAASVQKYKTAVKVGEHSPIIPLEPVGVRENGKVVLGAATKAPLTPAQIAAVQKHVNSVARTAAANRRLSTLAQKAQKVGTAAIAASKNTTAAIAAALQPKWRPGGTTTVLGHQSFMAGLEPDCYLGLLQDPILGGEVAQLLEEYYTAIGATPDPANPGFLTDGSPDPAFADPNAANSPGAGDLEAGLPPADDGGMGPVTAPDGTVIYDPATDPAVVPVPQRGGSLPQDEANLKWDHVPEDGIPYDGSKGLPQDSVGSWNVFYGTTKDKYGKWGIPGFLRGTPDNQNILWMYNAPENKDNEFHIAPDQFQSKATSGAPECSAVAINSNQRDWGQIIGRPDGPLANLQFAIIDKQWFWQGVYAPIWATHETDAKIVSANQKTIQANRTAALVQVAQMVVDARKRDEDKIKQDALNALAQSAADTQTNIVQQQVQAQQSQLDVQQQKADLDVAKATAMNEAQAQHALVTQADIWNKWAEQHPDEAVAQMQQGGAPGGGYDFADGEDDGGGYDEGDGDDSEDD